MDYVLQLEIGRFIVKRDCTLEKKARKLASLGSHSRGIEWLQSR
jgi:hypothetical protein